MGPEEYLLDRAEKKGLAKGLEKGIKKGRAEERAEARKLIEAAEAKAKNIAFEHARRMLEKGFDLETIAGILNVSVKEIKKLK